MTSPKVIFFFFSGSLPASWPMAGMGASARSLLVKPALSEASAGLARALRVNPRRGICVWSSVADMVVAVNLRACAEGVAEAAVDRGTRSHLTRARKENSRVPNLIAVFGNLRLSRHPESKRRAASNDGFRFFRLVVSSVLPCCRRGNRLDARIFFPRSSLLSVGSAVRFRALCLPLWHPMVARDTRPRSGGGTRVAARAGAETLALGVSGVGLKAAGESSPSRVEPGTTAVPEPPSARWTHDRAEDAMTGTPAVAAAPVTTRAPLGALDALRVDAAPVDFDALRDGDARGDAGTVSTRSRSSGAHRAGCRFAGNPDVPHVRQTHNWDCGLACALMVLKALVNQADADPSQARLPRAHAARRADLPTLRRMVRTTSVWTIDLAHLLASFELCDVAFYTVTLGANPAFSTETFYRDSIEDDASRVRALFENAAENGVLVEKRSVCVGNLKRWAASSEWIQIVLVDKRALVSSENVFDERIVTSDDSRQGGVAAVCATGERKTKTRSADAILDRVFGSEKNPKSAFSFSSREEKASEKNVASEFASPNLRTPFEGYTGHYVVVCGYDENTDCFCVRDPAVPPSKTYLRTASDDPNCAVPAWALENARRAFGTDEDLLLVRRRRGRE